MTNKISSQIKNQIPAHIRNNHELFVLFLEAYYEWLEKEENVYGFLNNFKKYFSLDKTLDDFIVSFKREFLQSIPDRTQIPKSRLIQHIKDYYLANGTEQGFKFLFKILFNESVSITYPKDKILKTSDGTWIANEQIIFVTVNNNFGDVTLRELSQQWTENNEVKTGKGTIKDIKIINNSFYRVARIVLTDVVGEFTTDHQVVIAGIYKEYIYPIIDKIDILSAGVNYAQQEEIEIVNGSYFNVIKNIPEELEVNLGVTSFLDENDLTVQINGIPQVPVTDYTFDGSILYVPNAVEGQQVDVFLPSYLGDIIVNRIGDNGEINEILIKETPIGFSSLPSYTINSTSGSGGSLTFHNDNNIFVEGRYKNTRGHLSSDMVLQDSDFYQEYSYVIRTGISLENYADVIRKTIHPAGFKFFGNIYSVETLRMQMKSFEDTFKVSLPPFVSIYDGIEDLIRTLVVGPPLGSREEFYDFHKDTHNDFSNPISMFGNRTIQDIHDKTGQRSNITPELDLKLKYLGSTVEEIIQSSFDLYRTTDWLIYYESYNRAESFILSY